jgi:hypothetical protein
MEQSIKMPRFKDPEMPFFVNVATWRAVQTSSAGRGQTSATDPGQTGRESSSTSSSFHRTTSLFRLVTFALLHSQVMI